MRTLKTPKSVHLPVLDRQEQGGQSRLMLGMFTIFPAFGMITPNNQQVITVDCVAETQAHAEEVRTCHKHLCAL